jgi:hypothetical protein
METLLPNKRFWQTKMEVVTVPYCVVQDALIFLKSYTVEQADEFGIHNKLMKI